MRETIQRLIDMALRGVILDEGRAREFAELAQQCEQEGGPMIVAPLQTAARTYRIKGMKGRAEAKALSVRYGHLLNDPVKKGRSERP